MKRFFFLLALLALPFLLQAQDKRLVVRRFDMNQGDLRAKADPVYDKTHKPAALVEIVFTDRDSIRIEGNIVGNPEHDPGKWAVYMPEGAQWIDLSAAGYAPVRFAFPAETPLLSAHTYLLELGVKTSRSSSVNPMWTLVMPTFSYNQSQLSYGLMLGLGRKNGGYVHAKTDFHFGINPSLSCDADGNIQGVKGWFSGEPHKSRFAVTAGYLRQLVQPLYVFVGGGYGSRILAWEMYGAEGSYDLVRVAPSSFTGVEAELGLIFRLGGFALSAGVQTNQFRYYEANVGIGVMF
jgi:hypothetical protein